jgi:hypothetical protein
MEKKPKKTKQALTFEDVSAMFKETNKQFRMYSIEADKRSKEVNKCFMEVSNKIKEMNEEFRVQSKEHNERFKVSGEHLDRLGKYIGGISHSNGDMAEEFFYNTLKKDKTFVNEKFDLIRKNLTYRGVDDDLEAEYDILLFNGTSAALIEVKYCAKSDNIDINKLIKRADVFKLQFPEYKNHKLYLGVAAMSFKGWIAKKLHHAGIATIRQVGRKMVIYDKVVKVF